MAWSFSGSGQYVKANCGDVVAAYPITIFARGKSTDIANLQALATFIQNSSPFNGAGLFFGGATGGDPMIFSKFGGVNANSAAGYSSGTWVSVAGRASGATQIDIDLDGTVTAGAATSVAFPTSPGPGDIQIAHRDTGGATNLLTGAAACIALWAAYLDDNEVLSLAKGFSPRRVRPQALKFYAPLVRDLRAPVDAKSGGSHSVWTTTGSPTVSDHPRSYGI